MTELQKFKLGWKIWSAGFLFIIAETIYFGSNYYPESRAELICDIIGLIICKIGIVIWIIPTIRAIKNYYKNIKDKYQ
jgi:hypothetical protein